jgi:hypothetical protein
MMTQKQFIGKLKEETALAYLNGQIGVKTFMEVSADLIALQLGILP